MSTGQRTVDYIVEQSASAGAITSRKMFGEYGLYCDGVLFGLVCDDQLFIKPTQAGRDLIGEVLEAPPYPGARPSLLIDVAQWDDRDFLTDLIRRTVANLPAAKPKTSRSPSKNRKSAL